MTDARERDLERIWGPVGGVGSALAQAEFRRQDQENRERWNREREARFAAAIAADKAEDARLAERQRQREAEQREAAEADVAKVRAAVERDLRLGGAPESQVRSLADEAMKSFHLARARETAERGAKADRELKDYFARQGRAASVAD